MNANGIKTAEDIIAKMRNTGAGMTRFDAKAISDKDAKEIAQYILQPINNRGAWDRRMSDA